MKLSFPVDSGYYVGKSKALVNRDCLNLYPDNPMARGASAEGGLVAMPGSSEFANLGASGAAGMNVFGDELYVVRRDYNTLTTKLWKVAENGTSTLLGTIPQTFTMGAVMANNGSVLCIVFPGQKSYFYDSTSGLVQITDSTFQSYEAQAGGVRSVTFVDGFFVFNTYETIFSGTLVTTNSGKNFDATYFVKPFLREKARKVMTVRGELVCFGSDTTKFYANIGGSDFPFQEIPGATIQKGITDKTNAIEYDNSYFFVGSGPGETLAVWRGIGGGAVSKISTDFVDREMNGTGFSIDLAGFMIDGRPFLAVSPGQGGTKVYDILSSSIKGIPVWFEWSNTTEDDLFNFSESAEAYGKIFFDTDPSLTYLDTSIASFYGQDDKEFRFTLPYMYGQGDPLVVNRLELLMDVGTGRSPSTSLTNTNPTVLLEYSDDGSETWNSMGSRSIGKFQKYGTRVVWHMLGISPVSRIFRFTIVTNIPVKFHRVDMEVEKGFLYG